MFTGIIESVGQITSINDNHGDFEIKIKYDSTNLNDISLGESISINGICLTVTKFDNNFLHFDLSKETISRISKFKINEMVNLETSLRVNSKISGHFVFGHVDGIAVIEDIEKLNDCEKWNIKVPNNLKKYIAKKGSISLNGVSLTVNSIENDLLSVNLIPFTLGHTTFQYNKIGESLNLEIDMLARYVETINNNK